MSATRRTLQISAKIRAKRRRNKFIEHNFSAGSELIIGLFFFVMALEYHLFFSIPALLCFDGFRRSPFIKLRRDAPELRDYLWKPTQKGGDDEKYA